MQAPVGGCGGRFPSFPPSAEEAERKGAFKAYESGAAMRNLGGTRGARASVPWWAGAFFYFDTKRTGLFMEWTRVKRASGRAFSPFLRVRGMCASKSAPLMIPREDTSLL